MAHLYEICVTYDVATRDVDIVDNLSTYSYHSGYNENLA